MNVLFVCDENQVRSRTAEEVFRDDDRIEAKSAGLRGGTIVSDTAVKWADEVVVFEERHKKELLKRFPDLDPGDVHSLEIGTGYSYNQPELRELIEERVEELC